MSSAHSVLVSGGGGFIGGHLVSALLAEGTEVRAVDIKPVDEWYQRFDGRREPPARPARHRRPAARRPRERSTIYNLAADMGGMGFIENNKALCMLSVLINTHLLLAAQRARRRALLLRLVGLRLRAPTSRRSADVTALKEDDAYPAMPEDGYGWEKLFSERMCRHFREDFGLDDARRPLPQRLRPARHLRRRPREGAGGDLPQGGRGEALRATTRSRSGATASRPAASCTSTTASTGTQALMDSDDRRADQPRHRTSWSRSTSSSTSSRTSPAIKLERRYNLDAPKGVRGRNSDNTLIKERLGWEPSIGLATGSSDLPLDLRRAGGARHGLTRPPREDLLEQVGRTAETKLSGRSARRA